MTQPYMYMMVYESLYVRTNTGWYLVIIFSMFVFSKKKLVSTYNIQIHTSKFLFAFNTNQLKISKHHTHTCTWYVAAMNIHMYIYTYDVSGPKSIHGVSQELGLHQD